MDGTYVDAIMPNRYGNFFCLLGNDEDILSCKLKLPSIYTMLAIWKQVGHKHFHDAVMVDSIMQWMDCQKGFFAGLVKWFNLVLDEWFMSPCRYLYLHG